MHWTKISLFEMKNIFLFLKSKKLHFYNTLILLYKTLINWISERKKQKNTDNFLHSILTQKKEIFTFSESHTLFMW